MTAVGSIHSGWDFDSQESEETAALSASTVSTFHESGLPRLLGGPLRKYSRRLLQVEPQGSCASGSEVADDVAIGEVHLAKGPVRLIPERSSAAFVATLL